MPDWSDKYAGEYPRDLWMTFFSIFPTNANPYTVYHNDQFQQMLYKLYLDASILHPKCLLSIFLALLNLKITQTFLKNIPVEFHCFFLFTYQDTLIRVKMKQATQFQIFAQY